MTDAREIYASYLFEHAMERMQCQQQAVLAGFKTVTLINGAAVVALLTYAGNFPSRGNASELGGAFFTYALGLAATTLAYFLTNIAQEYLSTSGHRYAVKHLAIATSESIVAGDLQKTERWHFGAILILGGGLLCFVIGSGLAIKTLTRSEVIGAAAAAEIASTDRLPLAAPALSSLIARKRPETRPEISNSASALYRANRRRPTVNCGLAMSEKLESTGQKTNGAFWKAGRIAAAPGLKAQINWLRDDTTSPLEDVASLWPGAVIIDYGLNKTFGAGVGASGAPAATLFAKSKNTGSSADVVSGMFVADVASAGKTGFGANIIAYSSGDVSGYKLVGLEIDVQPEAGTTMKEGGGLYVNAFTQSIPGPAIYVEGIFGGKWGTGLSVGNLSDIGSGIGPAAGNPRMGTLLDSGVAQYQIAAIKLNNLHRQVFNGVSGNPAALYVDASNLFHLVTPATGLAVRDNTDTKTLVSIQDATGHGVINVQSSAGEYRINGTKVVGARDTGWKVMSGIADKESPYDTRTVTLAQLAGRVKKLQDALTTHGLLGP
jgi:hypothetical protein